MQRQNMEVPFVALSNQFKSLEGELTDAFLKCGRSGSYILGPQVEEFENKAAQYCDSSHAIGVGNGSDALFLILKALKLSSEDEVIVPANSFIATAWVVVAAGAKLVLCDSSEDFNISADTVAKAITPRTRAILAVHLTGRPAPINEIVDLINGKPIFIIEDAAQAIGAEYYGKRAGGLGIAAGFSMHPLKNLGLYGDAGFITTNDQDLAETIRLLRNHGLVNRDECAVWGYNSRMDSLQAAFANVKIKYLDEWTSRHISIAKYYQDRLSRYVKVPFDKPHEKSVYHNFVIQVEKREKLIQALDRRGVQTKIHYPIPIHLQTSAKKLGYARGAFPNAENQSRNILSMPIYPELTDKQVEYVVDSLIECLE